MFRTSNNEGNAPRRFRRLICLGTPLLLLATACTETNDIVIDVGTAVLVVADSTLEPQGLQNADSRIQVAEWRLQSAKLILEGDPTERDLRFGKDCAFVDTAASSTPVSACTEDGQRATCKCSAGIILGIGDGSPVGATLDLEFSMQMRRGAPKFPEPRDDEDGDGIPNALDKCPYLFDVDDETDCVVDTDGDGSADGFDNCLWDTNPDQADTGQELSGRGGRRAGNGIGDACEEQMAVVKDREDMSATMIKVKLDAGDIPDLSNQVAFLVVDFQSKNSVECDWSLSSPECLLDTTAIVACVTTGTPSCP